MLYVWMFYAGYQIKILPIPVTNNQLTNHAGGEDSLGGCSLIVLPPKRCRLIRLWGLPLVALPPQASMPRRRCGLSVAANTERQWEAKGRNCEVVPALFRFCLIWKDNSGRLFYFAGLQNSVFFGVRVQTVEKREAVNKKTVQNAKKL